MAKGTLLVAGASDFGTTILALPLAFFPGTANYVTVVGTKSGMDRHDHAIYRRRGVFPFFWYGRRSKRLSGGFEPASVLAGGSYVERCNSKRCGLIKNYINGKWGKRFERKDVSSHDPSTEEVIAQVAASEAVDVDRAVKAARAAL